MWQASFKGKRCDIISCLGQIRFNVGFSDGKVELESPAILSPPLSWQFQCRKLDWESGRWRGFQIPESRREPLSPSSSSLTGGRLSRSGTLTTGQDRSTGLLRTTRSTDRPLVLRRPPYNHSLLEIFLPPPSFQPQVEVRE